VLERFKRKALVVCLASPLAAAVGCYGSTEPATDVTGDSAVLRAWGTTNNGPAQSYFEYWSAADPSVRLTTGVRDWPGGLKHAPHVERVTGLDEGTDYRFRMCGRDAGAAGFVCAQERAFETWTPDAVNGSGSNSDVTIVVDVESGPSGESPEGDVRGLRTNGDVFGAGVNCVIVSGTSALLGFSGTAVVSGHSGLVTGYARVVASEDPSAGQLTWIVERAEGPLNCANPPELGNAVTGDFQVTDSQPPPPPS
jgi:hypothetical protein